MVCTANHAWFLYGMLHWSEINKNKIFITADFKIVCQNVSMEVLLTGPKVQVKNSSHFGGCVLRERQLYALLLMAKD